MKDNKSPLRFDETGSVIVGCDKNANEVVIPFGVTTIGKWSFWGCSNLTTIEIPYSVTWIGDCAFLGCSGLTSVEIPDSVSRIGDCAFSSCNNLQAIHVSENNKCFKSLNGSLFSFDETVLIKIPPKSGVDTYYVPDKVIELGDETFSNNDILQSVIIGDSVKKYGLYLFANCRNLQEINLIQEHPEDLEISECAFMCNDCNDNYHNYLPDCTLFVPIGCGYAYQHDSRFKGKFKEIKTKSFKK